MNPKQQRSSDSSDQSKSKRIKLNLINSGSEKQKSNEDDNNNSFPLDKESTFFVVSNQTNETDQNQNLIDIINDNFSLSSHSSVSNEESIMANLAKNFPNFFNNQSSNDKQATTKEINNLKVLDNVHIPGILDKPSTSDKNNDLINKIESLNCDLNCVDDLSSLDSEHSSIDSFLDLNAINEINQVILDDPELLSILLDNNLPDSFLYSELLENTKNLTPSDDEIQILDEKEMKEFELDDLTLNRFIKKISKENDVSQETVRNIIVQHLKGRTAVFMSRFELSELQFKTAIISKVVKDFNYLKRFYQFRCWKKSVALSNKKRFDEFGHLLIDKCLSYEKMALIYYLYYENAEPDIYLNDDLALKILTDQQHFDTSLKSKIPNHQNSEQKLYELMIKMVAHYLSKKSELIHYLTGIKSTKIKRNDSYGKEIIIDEESPVDMLKLIYQDQSKQGIIEFNCDKIKNDAYKLIVDLYPSAKTEIIEDSFEECWSRYFKNTIQCYFKYELKYRCLKLLKNDLQIKLKTLLQRNPYTKINILGIEPIGCLNKEGFQYAIRMNDEIILNSYFDLNNQNEPFDKFFVELYKDYDFTILVIPTNYFSSKIRSLIHDVLITEMAAVKESIIVVDAPKDNELLANMTPYDRVRYYINRLCDPLRQWICYSSFMTIPDCEYFNLIKPNLTEVLIDQFQETICLLPIDINVEEKALLQYVNGLNEKLATEIVNYREKNLILNRKQLKEINGITEEIYKQSAAFIFINKNSILSRINDDKLLDLYDPYDSTIIHPDFYEDADRLLKYFKIEKKNLGTNSVINETNEILKTFKVDQISQCLKIDLVRVKVILNALLRPLNFDYRINLSI